MWMTNTNFANMYENSIARINLHQKNYKVCYIVYEYEFWEGWCGSILVLIKKGCFNLIVNHAGNIRKDNSNMYENSIARISLHQKN